MEWRWLLLVTSCAAPAPAPVVATSPSAPAPAPSSPWHDVEGAAKVREAVARLRGLPWQHEVAVHRAPRATFEALLASRGIAPHGGIEGAYLDDAVWLVDLPTPREALAHELVHALEAQHGIPEPEVVADEAQLAERTLHEGIAMAVARGVVAEHAGQPPRRAIAEQGAELAELTVSAIGEPFAERFPYVVGPALAGALYTTGGTVAWNAAEHAPPRSLVEALHPSLYLAGFTEAPREVVKLAGIQHQPLRGWQAQLLLEERMDPAAASVAMDSYRGGETLTDGAAVWWALDLEGDAARDVKRDAKGVVAVGSHVVVLGETTRPWQALPGPTLGSPPLRWPALAAPLHPIERDPLAVFVHAHGRAESPGLGIVWERVSQVQRRGSARSVLTFRPRELVSVLPLRLPRVNPVRNALTLLVQAFVTSEVARIEIREERAVDSPAGRVEALVVDTPEGAATVAVLPRCDDRYALALVAFEREVSAATLYARLADLRASGGDALCTRLRAEDGHDFEPPVR